LVREVITMSRPFEKAVKALYSCGDKRAALNAPGIAKLAPGPFEAQAKERAGVTDKELDSLSSTLMRPGFEVAQQAVRSFELFITGGSHGGRCGSPPRDASRLAFLMREGAEQQFSAASVTPLAGFALAARNAVKSKPEAFGLADDLDAVAAEREKLDAEFKRHGKELIASLRIDDLIIEEPTEQRLRVEGYKKVSLRCTGGAVNLGPDCAQHLFDWLCTQCVAA